MKYDKSLMAILLANAGMVPVEIYTQIMKYFGFTNISALEGISMMWVRDGSWLVGLIGATFYVAWGGLFFYHSPKIIGTDYFPLKVTLIGMTMQSLIWNIFGILGGNEKLVQGVSGNLVHASSAFIGSFIMGFLIKRYLFEETTQKKL